MLATYSTYVSKLLLALCMHVCSNCAADTGNETGVEWYVCLQCIELIPDAFPASQVFSSMTGQFSQDTLDSLELTCTCQCSTC
jgi:hypothetical protein